ncbi:MAG: hypothetical protein M3N91_04865 [Pseudomonadota bacterium]|nr:hypothetical protein [Pseudomonadota bacterium]
MKKFIGYCTFLVVVLSSISVTHAQSVTASMDVRCIVVGSRFSAMPDAGKQAAGRLLVMYYLGRVDAAFPNVPLAVELEKEDRAMTASDLQSETTRCSKYLTDRSLALQEIAKNLRRRAE